MATYNRAYLRINGKRIGELEGLDSDRMTARAKLYNMPSNTEWGPIVLERGMDIEDANGEIIITYEEQRAKHPRFRL